MKNKAFTLIELLIVIAIIALLMAILMPALNKAKGLAKRIHCVSNVRSLTIAWFMFQDENDGVLAMGNVPSGVSYKVSANSKYWVEPPIDESGAYTGDAPTFEDEFRGIKRGALYRYVQDIKAYRCPADERKRIPENSAYRSFSIAGGMNGEELNRYTKRAIKKYAEIDNPSTKYVFVEDADPRKWNMGSWILHPTGDSWGDPLSIWHDERSTLGWADGSAEMHQWLDERTIEMSREGQFGAIQPNNPDLKFMQKGYQLRPQTDAQ